MSNAYGAWAKGPRTVADLATRLRTAQLEMADQGRHPALWAPWVTFA
ncbi:MAG: hypothetical protein KDA28_03095 [Phycisphaerales bacterium]|nr:hypothetical protein [Phycisphaerales bacterium]